MKYSDFIESIKSNLEYELINEPYLLKHLIVPYSQGGSFADDNIIYLYPRDKWVAYSLLASEYPDDIDIVSKFESMGTSEGYTTSMCLDIDKTIWDEVQLQKLADRLLVLSTPAKEQ